jgi:hypothetical protein
VSWLYQSFKNHLKWKFLKWPTSHSCHLSFENWLFFQIFNLPHPYNRCLKTPISNIIIINFTHGSKTWSNHIKSQCLTNHIHFIKNISIFYKIYFHFLVHCYICCFTDIYSNITSYEIKKCSLFNILLFCILTYQNT